MDKEIILNPIVEKIPLIKVNVIGMKYVHCFKKNDGTFIELETTKEDYEQLATTEHINPTMEDAVWYGSMGKRRVDTTTGDLEYGQYFQDITSVVAKLGDGKEYAKPTLQDILIKKEEIDMAVNSGIIQKINLQKIPLSIVSVSK